jgi:hypothetical protein
MQNRGFKTLLHHCSKVLTRMLSCGTERQTAPNLKIQIQTFTKNYSHIKKLFFTIKKYFNKKLKKNETIKGVFRIKITNSKLKILNLKKKEKLIFPGYLKRNSIRCFHIFFYHTRHFLAGFIGEPTEHL